MLLKHTLSYLFTFLASAKRSRAALCRGGMFSDVVTQLRPDTHTFTYCQRADIVKKQRTYWLRVKHVHKPSHLSPFNTQNPQSLPGRRDCQVAMVTAQVVAIHPRQDYTCACTCTECTLAVMSRICLWKAMLMTCVCVCVACKSSSPAVQAC